MIVDRPPQAADQVVVVGDDDQLEVAADRVPAAILGAVDQVGERGGERVDIIPVTYFMYRDRLKNGP